MGDSGLLSLLSNVLGIGQALFGVRMKAVLLSLAAILGYHVAPMWQQWKTGNQLLIAAWTLAFAVVLISALTAMVWPENLVRNGRFTSGVKHWGTGYLEDELRDGTPRHTDDAGRLPYRAYPSSTRTNSSGQHLVVEDGCRHVLRRHSCIYRLDYRGEKADEHWGALAQRIHGLKPGSRYVLRFCAKGSSDDEKAFFATASLTWEPNIRIPPSSRWVRYKHVFYSHPQVDYTEIRFVVRGSGHLLVSHVSVQAPFWKRTT